MSTTTPPEVSPGLRGDAFDGAGEDPSEQAAQPLPRGELEDIEKAVEHKSWTFRGKLPARIRGQDTEQEWERTFVQKPLSYLAMMQFTGLLGRKIDEAMSGDEGMSIESLSDLAEVANVAQSGIASLGQGDFAGIDAFVRGFAKLTAYVPDIIAEAQCIWLRVPIRDRMPLVELWSKPVDEGGLSMDEGEEMMDLFIRQNYEELERFFLERSRRIVRTVQAERKKRSQHAD